MVAFILRMPAGIPGDVNRAEIATVEPQVITPAGNSNAPVSFGTGIVIDSTTGQVRAPISSDTAIYGLLARAFPLQGGQTDPLSQSTTPFGTGTVPSQGACDVLKRGYMTVNLLGGTAATKSGAVYVVILTYSSIPVGSIVAAANGSNTLALPGSYFSGPADSNGIVEVAFNI